MVDQLLAAAGVARIPRGDFAPSDLLARAADTNRSSYDPAYVEAAERHLASQTEVHFLSPQTIAPHCATALDSDLASSSPCAVAQMALTMGHLVEAHLRLDRKSISTSKGSGKEEAQAEVDKAQRAIDHVRDMACASEAQSLQGTVFQLLLAYDQAR